MPRFTFAALGGENYDQEVISSFYSKFLKPNFGVIEGELDPLSVWLDALKHDHTQSPENGSKGYDSLPKTEIICAYEGDKCSGRVAGGVAFDFYPLSKSVVISYWVVGQEYKRMGIGSLLLEKAEQHCKRHLKLGSDKQLGGMFLETNNPIAKAMLCDVMDPFQRLRIFASLGFRQVDIRYVQPPLEAGAAPLHNTLLLCFRPSSTGCVPRSNFLDASLVATFLTELYQDCYSSFDSQYDSATDSDLQTLLSPLVQARTVRLLDLSAFFKPTTAGRGISPLGVGRCLHIVACSLTLVATIRVAISYWSKAVNSKV